MPVKFEFDKDKAIAAIVYIASRGDDEVTALDKYKLAKLIFLADKFHLVRYGRPILGDTYKALEYGPIPQNVLDLLNPIVEISEFEKLPLAVRGLAELLEVDRRFSYPRVKAKRSVSLDVLSKSDLNAINYVIRQHGRKTFEELRVLTHGTATYRKAWEAKQPGFNAAYMSYETFFEEDADAIKGAFEEMIENDALRKLHA